MRDVKFSNCSGKESVYIGCWDAHGRRNGFGLEKWKNKEHKYEGTFVKDAFHGEGVYQWFTGKQTLSFEGQFYSNIKEGYAFVSLPDGSVFEGLFCNNRPFGPGIQTDANGCQDVGFWCGNKMIRLSRPVDFIIPRLASTSLGKLKLLQFQVNTSSIEEESDVTTAIHIKLGLDSNRCTRLYSDLIHDPRSMFFNKDGLESPSTCRRKNCTISKCSPEEGFHSSNDAPHVFASGEKIKQKCVVPRIPDLCSIRHNGNVYEKYWKYVNGESVITEPLAWNSNQLFNEMLKHIFRFRSFEERLTFDILDLISGARTKFRKTGETEKLCLQFLRMCSIGPCYIIKDMLCTKKLSEQLTDSRGNNSIMFAAATDQHDIIELLADYGTEVNSLNDENLTPLNLCLLRRIAESASLGNWEISFLSPETNVGQVKTKTWQDLESIESLDRIFGNGMSLGDSGGYAKNGGCMQTDSIFLFEENNGGKDSQDSSHVTVLLYKQNEEEEDGKEFTRKSLSREAANEEFAKGICPKSFKREEYARSVAEPTIKDRYFFDLKPKKFKVEENYWENSYSLDDVQSKMLNNKDEKHSLTLNKIKVIEKTIEVILKRGGDPNLGHAPKPSLHLALYSNQPRLLRLLLSYGAAPDSQTLPQEGLLTPLHALVLMKPSKEQVLMCELLLNYGANPEEETSPNFDGGSGGDQEDEPLLDPDHGRTPLQVLCTRQDAEWIDPQGFLGELARLLVNVSKMDHFFRGHSYLTLAMISGNYALAKALLDSKRIDPNQVLPRHLGTALHVLVSAYFQKRTLLEDSIRMCDLLLEHGANPNLIFRTPPSLAGNCVDYGYRQIDAEKNARLTTEHAQIISDTRNYLQDHVRVVEYLEGKLNRRNYGQSWHKIKRKQGVTGGDGKIKSETRKERQNKQQCRGSTQGKMPRGEQERVNTEPNEIGEATIRNAQEETAINNDNKIIEIKKYVEKGKLQKARDGKEGTKSKGKTEKEQRLKTDKWISQSGRDINLKSKQEKYKHTNKEKDITIPQSFTKSLLHLFGICGQNIQINHFLLPYVVLRNGDLYYRFKGRKTPPTEQYSLI